MYHFNHKTKGVYLFSIKYGFLSSIFVIVAALLAGCASGPKSYGIKGEGDSVLNRDVNGKSLSVVVRIYQLRDPREFSKLTFDTLADGRPESELLGPALLDKTDAVIVPGGGYTSTEKLHEETRYVGIVGFFRRPDTYYWRQLVEADAIRGQGLNFRVQDCYIVLNGAKPFPLPGQPANARPECGTANQTQARPAARPAAQSAQPQPVYPAARQQPQPYPQGQQAYPQPGYPSAQQGYPQPAPATPSSQRGWLPQGMPDVNISTNTPVAPANVRIGSGGVSSVTVGDQAPAAAGYPAQPAPYYGQPYPGQPAYGQPYPPQPYPSQNSSGAPRY